MAEDQSNTRSPEDGSAPDGQGSPHPDGGQEAEKDAAADAAIGPVGAAPQWRDFYRAIRDAVSDMRSGK
ncbi:hypothetical protein [Paenibacillus sacheonensis]|uniref:Uncharacterized protein n=1 Tax=Paenibacillus sacheonensis TaxID=742054 RepID=A0A7X5C0P3_9BACL|nr:hypothetical protein [Paenibacillus sacheonensis]MBM7569212.1 hypothetical protein [Paenibacillus sacheonensis]NBC71776.1 hypothetical protein [Paenibacillus sacheonensis]